jgi:hypothetical protein
MSQLGLGLGLTRGGGVPFNPLSLNPYLLFDTRSSMIGTLENPTLDLDPSKPDTLNVITATRAGTATYTDANGNIATAAADTVRVDYTQGEELTPTKYQNIGYTDFSQSWDTYLGTATLGDGYDGHASLVSSFTGNGQSYHYFESVDGRTYTGSFWARAVSGSGPFRLVHGNSATGSSTLINLTSEWQFFSVQFLGRSGGGSMYFGIGAQNGDQVEIAMPQVEEGTTASDFVANTTGSPKFITGATYGPRVPMILVEPSSENLLPYSEDFDAGNWAKVALGTGSNPVITPDYAVSPDGTQNASRIQFDKGSGTASSDLSILRYNLAVTSGTPYSKSIYLKSNTNEAYDLILHESTDGSGTNVKKLTVTPEWQRFDVYGNVPASEAGISFGLRNLNITGVSDAADVLVWGAQLEAGSVSTSYIPTSGGDAAARTRAADDLVISGSDFTDFYNGSEGTFYIEAVDRQATGSSHAYLGGQDTTRLFLYNYDDLANLITYDGANDYQLGSIVSNQLFRGAVSYKTGVSPAPSVLSLSFNGTTTSDQPYSENFSTTNILKIGSGYSKVFSGHFRRIIYWPYHSDRL